MRRRNKEGKEERERKKATMKREKKIDFIIFSDALKIFIDTSKCSAALKHVLYHFRRPKYI